MKSDHQLKQDVIEELAWEPSVNETEIGVEVKNGIVTLAGHLSSYAQKYAAECAVQRVSDVKGIAIELDVRLPSLSMRTDADIASTAARALEWNCLVPWEKIQIKVEQGWITLKGEVEWSFQRQAVENTLRPLMGVVGISNQIRISPSILEKNIKASIEAALYRHVQEEAKRISILVDSNQVTLSGAVPSLRERNAAYLAALSTPGVSHVIDHLTIL